MRLTVGAAVAATAFALAASPSAADPVSVPFVSFTGGAGGGPGTAAPAGDVNGDGHDDVVIGDASATSPASKPFEFGGAAYVVFGPFVAGSRIDLGNLGTRGFLLRGYGNLGAGNAVAAAGDVNGDGLDDVLVGAGNQERASGRVFVVFGRRRPHTVDLGSLGRRGITLRGERHKRLPDNFGTTVSPLGDINGDGLSDVGIAAPGSTRERSSGLVSRPGRAYVIFGRRAGGTISMSTLGRAGFRIAGASGIRGVFSAGDWGGDGRPDIAVAGGWELRANLWIVDGRRYRSELDLSQRRSRGVVIRAPAGSTAPWFGGVAIGGDVDGDSRPDVVLGTPWAHRDQSAGQAGGGAWLIRGSRSRTTVDLSRPGSRAWELVSGDPQPHPESTGADTAYAGSAVALGQFDNDGQADVLLTAGHGVAVIFGSASRTTRRLSTLAPEEGYLIRTTDFGGISSAQATDDMNGDGRSELLVVAPAMPSPSGMSPAAAYLIFAR